MLPAAPGGLNEREYPHKEQAQRGTGDFIPGQTVQEGNAGKGHQPPDQQIRFHKSAGIKRPFRRGGRQRLPVRPDGGEGRPEHLFPAQETAQHADQAERPEDETSQRADNAALRLAAHQHGDPDQGHQQT